MLSGTVKVTAVVGDPSHPWLVAKVSTEYEEAAVVLGSTVTWALAASGAPTASRVAAPSAAAILTGVVFCMGSLRRGRDGQKLWVRWRASRYAGRPRSGGPRWVSAETRTNSRWGSRVPPDVRTRATDPCTTGVGGSPQASAETSIRARERIACSACSPRTSRRKVATAATRWATNIQWSALVVARGTAAPGVKTTVPW